MKEPQNTISFNEAKEMQQEYIKTRANSLNKILDKEKIIKGKDVIDVTFDLETLKEYIAYVEEEAEKKGLKGLGLRVCLGAYNKNEKVKTPGYSTVFFMPTYQSKSNKNSNLTVSNEIIEGVSGLNKGISGLPPHNL